MKKLINWIRKNKKKIMLTDAVLIIAACVFLLAAATPAEVQGLAVSDSTYSTAQISWEKSDKAIAYRVYRSADGENYEYLDTTTDTSYTDKKLRTGDTYYYAVTARNGLRATKVNKEAAVSVVPSLTPPDLKVDTT